LHCSQEMYKQRVLVHAHLSMLSHIHKFGEAADHVACKDTQSLLSASSCLHERNHTQWNMLNNFEATRLNNNLDLFIKLVTCNRVASAHHYSKRKAQQ